MNSQKTTIEGGGGGEDDKNITKPLGGGDQFHFIVTRPNPQPLPPKTVTCPYQNECQSKLHPATWLSDILIAKKTRNTMRGFMITPLFFPVK